MKGAHILGAAVLLGSLIGCASWSRGKILISERDFNDIAEASLKRIDPGESITAIVVPSSLDPRAQQALARLHRTIPASQVHESGDIVLPAGYFLVQEFHVDLDGAVLKGQLGPVARKMTTANLPDCGKIYEVPFILDRGEWFNPNYKVSTCNESRQWWPADDPAGAKSREHSQR